MSEKSILIVDDDRDLVRALSIRLTAAGYRMFCAHDAVSAGLMVRKERPNLIMLDIGLPGGDGFIVMERLKKLSYAALAPIIILTARDPANTRRRALQAGAVAFFQKPADPARLLATVRRALGEGEPAHRMAS